MTELKASKGQKRRELVARCFQLLFLSAALVGVVLLVVLLIHVARQGVPWLDSQFLTSFLSRFPERAGIKSALVGTLWLIGLTAIIALPIGVAAAIYMEEYARKSRLSTLIEININNLAGVPSIVYGMVGLAVFVRALALGTSILAGACTMSLVILPVIIVASREAVRAVPKTLREAAFALGANRWQTVRYHVLPAALPGILTGSILALSRAMGETAPLVMIGALTYVAFLPEGPLDSFTVLPLQIYAWASKPQQEFHNLAAAAILVLLAVLLSMNAAAVFIRHRFQKRGRW